MTTEICAYLPKLPRAKPRTSSRPQQSSAPIGVLEDHSRRAALRSARALARAFRPSRRAAQGSPRLLSRGFMDVMVVACATASHAAPVLRMSAPTQSRSPSCASAARGRDNRAEMPHWQAVTWSFRRVRVRSSSAPALTLHPMRGNDRLLTDERPIDGARAPPLLPCAADDLRFLDASVSDRRSRSHPTI